MAHKQLVTSVKFAKNALSAVSVTAAPLHHWDREGIQGGKKPHLFFCYVETLTSQNVHRARRLSWVAAEPKVTPTLVDVLAAFDVLFNDSWQCFTQSLFSQPKIMQVAIQESWESNTVVKDATSHKAVLGDFSCHGNTLKCPKNILNIWQSKWFLCHNTFFVGNLTRTSASSHFPFFSFFRCSCVLTRHRAAYSVHLFNRETLHGLCVAGNTLCQRTYVS